MSEECLINRLKQKEIRQFLRNNQTDAEAILWQSLRRKELGEKFVRQHGIEKYIVDFCCRRKKLIIELDGNIHDIKDIKENDVERTKDLEKFGYKVLRFQNSEVLNNLDQVLTKIKSFIK